MSSNITNAVETAAVIKPRKLPETVELQVDLKDYDQIMNSASTNKHLDQEQLCQKENAKSEDEQEAAAVGFDPMDDPAEQAHFKQVVGAFFFYQVSSAPRLANKNGVEQYEALRDIARIERDFASMPQW